MYEPDSSKLVNLLSPFHILYFIHYCCPSVCVSRFFAFCVTLYSLCVCSKAVLFCGSFSLFGFRGTRSCQFLVVTCWERVDLYALFYVMFLVFLSLPHMVSWASCGILLYEFLIFAYFLTFLVLDIYFSEEVRAGYFNLTASCFCLYLCMCSSITS